MSPQWLVWHFNAKRIRRFAAKRRRGGKRGPWMLGGGLRRRGRLVLGLAVALGACSHHAASDPAVDAEINTPPTDYKREILGAMHAYLNDPTGIRDAEIAEPAIKSVGGLQRYVVCLRFNARKRGNDYAGVKEIAAVFMVGRFDRFVDKAQEQCAGAAYTPFPDLQKLSR
jgi:hypothetical protein